MQVWWGLVGLYLGMPMRHNNSGKPQYSRRIPSQSPRTGWAELGLYLGKPKQDNSTSGGLSITTTASILAHAHCAVRTHSGLALVVNWQPLQCNFASSASICVAQGLNYRTDGARTEDEAVLKVGVGYFVLKVTILFLL